MSDILPPSGPPPPKVPAGWKAQWNDQYSEWFYVNIYTKKSQWDKPTEPVYPNDDSAPPGPPPGYSGSGSNSHLSDTKTNPYDNSRSPGSSNNIDEDAALAARLQAEEDARARAGGSSSRNAQQDYQNTPMSQQYQDLPPREQKKSGGFLGKLLGKASGSSHTQQPQYQQSGYGAPQQAYGYGAPQQAYGYGAPQQAYGYGPPQQAYGYGPPQQAYGQQQPKKSGGLGTMGGAALGLGGGLIGGMLLEDAIEDHDQSEYQQGYDQGQQGDGDYGGGDDGGDMGGDF